MTEAERLRARVAVLEHALKQAMKELEDREVRGVSSGQQRHIRAWYAQRRLELFI